MTGYPNGGWLEGVEHILWVSVPGFPDYEVSSSGSVRSFLRSGHAGRASHPRILAGKAHADGYRRVTLRNGARTRCIFVHVLVLEIFHGPRPRGHVSRHLNGNPADNSANNLAWGTAAENMQDKERHGTSNRGDRNGMSKLRPADIPIIRRRLASGELQRSIGEDYDVSYKAIADIKSGRTWGHIP